MYSKIGLSVEEQKQAMTPTSIMIVPEMINNDGRAKSR